MSSSRASRRQLVLLMLLLLLSSCSGVACCMELSAAAAGNVNRPARRLLVSRPSTSRQKAEQQMRIGGAKVPFKPKQARASFGRRIPRSGWNPIQNR